MSDAARPTRTAASRASALSRAGASATSSPRPSEGGGSRASSGRPRRRTAESAMASAGRSCAASPRLRTRARCGSGRSRRCVSGNIPHLQPLFHRYACAHACSSGAVSGRDRRSTWPQGVRATPRRARTLGQTPFGRPHSPSVSNRSSQCRPQVSDSCQRSRPSPCRRQSTSRSRQGKSAGSGARPSTTTSRCSRFNCPRSVCNQAKV